MPMSAEFRDAVMSAHETLKEEGRPSGAPHVERHIRYEQPFEIEEEDEDCLFDTGYRTQVGRILRNVRSARGERLIVSASVDGEQSYVFVQGVLFEQALDIRDRIASSVDTYSVQLRSWNEIVTRLRVSPGATVGDLFPTEASWDDFWTAMREAA